MSSSKLSTLRRITSSAFVTCVAATTIAAASSGCSGDKITQGELIVAVQTDMSLPKDVDQVRIEVTSFGNVVFKNSYPVGAGGLRIPATLGILPGTNARALVTIRVIAMQRGKPRMLREVVTTVPSSRLATLRLPIQWLSDGSAKVQGQETGTDGGGQTFRSLHPAGGATGEEIIVSTCPAEQTNIAGDCVDWNVDSDTLPDYVAEDVFGGGKEDGSGGACFDTLGCMQHSVTVQPDGSCTIIPPANEAGRVNVALRLPLGGDGICDATDCYIPLDSAVGSGWVGTSGDAPAKVDPPPTGGAQDSGTVEPAPDAGKGGGDGLPDAGRIRRVSTQAGEGDVTAASGPITSIKLPAVICRKLTAGLQAQVVVSTGCATKLPSNPTCGPWSSVTGSGGTPPVNVPSSDGGVSERDAAIPVEASIEEEAGTIPDGSTTASFLTIAPQNVNIAPLQSLQFTAFVVTGGKPVEVSATWSIDDPNIGTISPASGFFTASSQSSGFTFVRATAQGLNAETMVTLGSTSTDAGVPPDAGAGCTPTQCNSTPDPDGGTGTCNCSANCGADAGFISMFCNGTDCFCNGGSNLSGPQGSICANPSNFFNNVCLGQ